MKKSVKKACSIALLFTSAAAVSGLNTLVQPNSYKANGNAVFAEQAADTLTLLKVEGASSSALLGNRYDVPAANLYVNGSLSTVASYTVTSPIGEDVTVDSGAFSLDRIGTYTINYSAEYDGKTYTASAYVDVSTGKNSIEIAQNTSRTLPNYVYQSYTGDLFVPTASVKFAEDSQEVEYDMAITVSSPTQQAVTFDATTGKLNLTSLEEGTYSVKYVATTKTGNIYLNTLSQEFTVLSDDDYKDKFGSLDYTLKFDYSKTVPTSADIGEELTLPTPMGKIGTESTPVYYTIDALVYIDGQTYDVTSQTISDGNKFTAKKSYTINGTEHTVTNAKYLFYYNVTDALGKQADRTGFEISGVKDTKAPKVVIADPYSVTATEVSDVSYKLQTNFTNGKNVVIKAMYAEDLADKLSDLTLVRYIRKSTQSSSEEDIYSDARSNEVNAFTKDLVFNKTDDFNFDANTMIDAGALAEGDYTVYYKATDSANNTVTEGYSFHVNNDFEFTKDVNVEFKDSFAKSVKTGDKITFEAPVASNDDADRLFTEVSYKYSNEPEWTVLTPNENGKYSIVVNKDGASSVSIKGYASNNVRSGEDVKEILIVDNQDTEMPEVVSLGDWEASYDQNDDVVLPTLTLTDDLVKYVDVDVEVRLVEDAQGEEADQLVDVQNGVVVKAGDTLTFTGARFYATLAGRYNVTYKITDAGNNQVFIYQSVSVTEVPVIGEPVFGNLPEALSDGKLELGESVELPIPTYPSGYSYTVNYEGWSGASLNDETFTPKKVGTYTLVYRLYDSNNDEVADATRKFKVVVSDTTAPEVQVEWTLADSYAVNSEVVLPVFSASDISGINLETSKIEIRSNSYSKTIKASEMLTETNRKVTLRYNEQYTVTYTVYDKDANKNSTVKTFTIKVGDLVAPTLKVEDGIVASTVKIDSTLSIDISKITVSDNKTKTLTNKDVKIVVKNTTTGETLDNNLEDQEGKYEYTISAAGEYTVTFSVSDDAGNTKTVTRTFTVNESTNSGISTNEVVTIVLSCVAVVVLAGAIVYMVVSKKKTQQYK